MNPGMKLLMISGFGAASLEKQGAFYNTLEELHKHWERIDIISVSSRWFFSRPIEHVFFGNVFVHRSPLPLFLQPLFILIQGVGLVSGYHHNVMTVHEYPPFYNGMGAWLLHMWTKIPYVAEIMHIPGYPRAAGFKERLYLFLMQNFIGLDTWKAKFVRIINQHEAPKFLADAGIPREKMVYIPAFYIDLNIFLPRDIPKRYDLIFVGRLVQNKGIFLFLDALRKGNHSAMIVGTGPEAQSVRAYIWKHNLQHRVTMHGWAKDSQEVAKLLNESRVLVMSSYNEGGPRVVLEAMACGVPVIATSVGIVHDTIENGVSGLKVPWDGDAIAGSVEKLLSNEELYRRFREKGLEIVKKFERTLSIQKLAEWLKSAA